MINLKKNNNGGCDSAVAVSSAKAELKNRSLMLVLSIVLFVAAAVFFAYAWFTKMASISSLQFDVAQWDYRANYQSGELYVKVYEYTNLNTDKAAPGTEGYVPLVLQGTQSDADITYTLNVDGSKLSSDFSKRLLFYYRNGDTSAEYKKTGEGYDDNTLILFNGSDQILEGVVPKNSSVNIDFYWRWVYDAKEALEKELIKSSDITGLEGISDDDWTNFKACVSSEDWDKEGMVWSSAENKAKYKAAWEAYYEAWDDFDLQVGTYTDAFEKEMRALVKSSGIQINTRKNTEDNTDNTGNTDNT